MRLLMSAATDASMASFFAPSWSLVHVSITGLVGTTDSTLRLQRWNLFWLVLVASTALVLGAIFFVRMMTERVARLEATWRGDNLHIHSAKDGPFIVTHLFKPWINDQESCVAQLPQPMTIIDSRGHYFSGQEISSLIWIGASGRTNTPPSVGTPLRVFYLVPCQTD